MEPFELVSTDERSYYRCKTCQIEAIEHDVEPATDTVYQTRTIGHGEYAEPCEVPVTVVLESYLSLECPKCNAKHFESL